MKFMNKLINWYKYRVKPNVVWLKVFNSPLKGLKLKWYFGEIKHGTPYFLPRKWVNCD